MSRMDSLILTVVVLFLMIIACTAAYSFGYKRGQAARDQAWCEGMQKAGYPLGPSVCEVKQ